MSIFKKITLIVSVLLLTLPAHAMDYTGIAAAGASQVWQIAQEYPVATAVVAGAATLGAYAITSRNAVHDYVPVRRSWLEEVQSQCQSNPALVRFRNYNGETHLHKVDDPDIASILLQYGADLEARDNEGFTPLHRACVAKNYKLAKFLLGRGAHSNVYAIGHFTPLHTVILDGTTELIELLLDYRAAIVHCVNGQPEHMLHFAVARSSREAVALLLKKGAEIQACDKEGLTALHYAVGSGSLEMIRFLVAKGADMQAVDKYAETPLHKAVRLGRKDIVDFFLERGMYNEPKIAKNILDEERQRVCTAVSVFNRLKLSRDVQKKIASYLADEVVSSGHADMLLGYGLSSYQVALKCPLAWLVELYTRRKDVHKAEFLEMMVPLLVDIRLRALEQFLAVHSFESVAAVHPQMIAILQRKAVEQHRSAIENFVRSAFKGESRELAVPQTNDEVIS